ncbi:MAG: LuxR C-terminal-related transcriptional regulator [Chloroflexota bacterium]|nr:LuxR C-terminal-related transcriptional regulator [Chloroflexota bacterium]
MSDAITSTRPIRSKPLATPGVPASPLLNPILGRDDEIDQVRALLDGDGVRVLSLLGPGGVGKTRLALEVMRQAATDFAHGARFVSLAPVRDHALVPYAVAQSLGIQESGSLQITELLATWLRTRHFLLVLDNMEQVVGAASPWLVELLASCSRLKVLVTSRIPLDITGEQRFRVPPLPVPDLRVTPLLDGYASVELFAQRAYAVRVDFALDAGNREVIAQICTRLDGLPLAIELAAARVNLFSPAEILSRLTDRFNLLTGDRRDAPPRLRSMRDAIGWSYDLLSAPEQDLFNRLAVFVGDFSLDAAECVAASQSGGAADSVAALIDQSLVERIEGVDETRFRMLETIREFGLARLAERGELVAARDAHAAFFKEMAVQAQAGLRGPNQAWWLKRLEAEHGNLREAMSWLTTTDRIPEAVELFSQIVYFMLIHAHFSEGRQLLEDWLARTELAHRTRTRALALLAGGLLTVNLGEPASAIGSLREASELFRELDDRGMTMFSLNVLTFAYSTSGDIERARTTNDQSLPMAREVGDARDLALALTHLAHICWDEGDSHRAHQVFEEGLAVARRADDAWMVANTLISLGLMALDIDEDLGHAQRLFDESRTIQEGLGDKRSLPVTHNNLAAVARAQGDLELAKAHLRMSSSIAQETGQTMSEAYAHLDLSAVARLQHDLERSAWELRRALSLFQQAPHPSDIADCLGELAAMALAAGDAPQAARFLGASDSLLRDGEASLRMSWPPGEHARLIEQARALLGETPFLRFHAEGRGWSMDDALAVALAYELPAAVTGQPANGTPAHRLSPRELDVLRLMANGHSNQHIADELYLSRRTVTSHVTSILGKLDLTSRTQAVAFAIRSGIA